MKPIIGITPSYDSAGKISCIRGEYTSAVRLGGGVPFIFPERSERNDLKRLLERCDGVLFAGGQDFAARYYGGGDCRKNGAPSELRDELEFPLMELALEGDKAILGICRGAQLLCLSLGGKVMTDISSEVATDILHDMKAPYDVAAHDVIIEKGSPLYEVVKTERLGVNSRHHQAVEKCPGGLSVMARAEDGVIEAMYMPGRRFVWGIQWHPELMIGKDAAARMIFESFVKSARQ